NRHLLWGAAPLLVRLVAGKHPVGAMGEPAAEAVARNIETLDRRRLFNAPANDVGTHQAARLLRREADDLVIATSALLEYRCDHLGRKRFRMNGLEVFVGGKIDQRPARLFQIAIQRIGDALAPELVEVAAARGG